MIRTFRSRLVAVSTGVLLTAATLGSLAPMAQAETVAGQIPATITASPTTGLVSGSTVTVSATADTNWNIYSLRARLCKSDAVINNAGDFSPTLGGNCVSAPLANNTDSDVTVNTEPGSRGSASLDFKVGAGSNTFTTQYDGSTTIACGVTSATGCKLVVEMSATNLAARVIYTSFPLTYALPAAPTSVTAAWGNAKALVSWTAPASQQGLPAVTSYTVTSSPGSFTCTTATTSCEVPSLSNGTPYTFSVVATNALGDSSASTPSTAVTPSSAHYVLSATPTTGLVSGNTVAQSVTMSSGYNLYSVRTRLCLASATINNAGDFSPTLGGNCAAAPLASNTNNDVTVTTTAGNRNAATLNFKVGSGTNTFTSQYDGSKTVACGPSAPAACALVTELSYTTALGVGKVVYTSTALTYATAPAAPAAPTGVRNGTGAVTVSWTAPASDSTITGYTVEASPQVASVTKGCTVAGNVTSCSVTGLTNATSYTFKVKATSAAGVGAFSANSQGIAPSATAAAVSANPSGFAVDTASNGTFVVHWTAPTDNRGSSIISYTVTATKSGETTRSCTVNFGTNSCSVANVVNGVKYTLKLVATNSKGNSTGSSLTNKLTTAAPDAPTGVSATQTGNSTSPVKVSWTKPNTNGSTITLYTVTAYRNNVLVDGKSCTSGGAANCTISGLTKNTTYTFKVTATNGAGISLAGVSSGYTTKA